MHVDSSSVHLQCKLHLSIVHAVSGKCLHHFAYQAEGMHVYGNEQLSTNDIGHKCGCILGQKSVVGK